MPSAEDYYRQMIRMHFVELELTRLSQSGDLRGSLHLAQGQEAVPAGACAALQKDDYLTATYRGHGYVLAKGVDLSEFMAEVLGKATGLCGGFGGKMHLFDPAYGVLGTNGIVAAGIGTAVGAALAAKLDGNKKIAMTVFGDGAINQGHCQECFNMAVLFSCPVIFLCENNLYSEMTPLERSHGNQNLCERVGSFGMPTISVDGNEPEAVYKAVSKAAKRARNGFGPTFIEALTYRTIGHYQSDPGTAYRTQAEIDKWKAMSPIGRYETRLGHKAKRIKEEEEARVRRAVERALAAPEPDPKDADQKVFA
jgi:TPP-dependent pyruvate/acetoin dehydrogenase alpha subunit